MTGCSAKGCNHSTVKGYIMKRFPRDPARRNSWAARVKREGWQPTNASCLCEEHFDDSQWENHDWAGTPKLKRTAVPTLFCNCNYGKKRSKNAALKTANLSVMTEHSYGSVLSTENSQHIIKGKLDRRGDHRYAIAAEEECHRKRLPGNEEAKKENMTHNLSCPMYNSRMRKRTHSMDTNNNGRKTGALGVTPTFNSDLGLVPHGEVTLVQIGEESPLNEQIMSPADPHIVRVVVMPERKETEPKKRTLVTKVIQAPTICVSHPVTENRVGNEFSVQSNLPMETGLFDASGNFNKKESLSNDTEECFCRRRNTDISKIKAAERVLARQGRLVKRVATLQKQLFKQKKSHEMEIEKLMKKFHELEEKFDLTRSILRTCVNDDQLTVRASNNSKGVIWSKKTVEKAMHLRSSCGPDGYRDISKLLIPLPSMRTLERHDQQLKTKTNVFVEIVPEIVDE